MFSTGVNSDGRSLGYAHVKFQSSSSAEKVYKDHEENPVTIDGREIRIDFAAPRGSKVSPQRADRSPRAPSSTLFVGNLSEEVTKEDMLEVLQPLGGVVQIRLGALLCKLVNRTTY
jgi:nucleolin